MTLSGPKGDTKIASAFVYATTHFAMVLVRSLQVDIRNACRIDKQKGRSFWILDKVLFVNSATRRLLSRNRAIQ